MAIQILHTRWCRPGPSFTYMFLAKKNCQTGQVWGIHNDMSYTHVCHITAKLLHSAHTITSTTSSVTFLAIIHCVIKLDIHISANLLTKENITSTLKWRRIFSWYLVKPGIYTCNYACTLTSELPWLGVTQICKLGAKFLVDWASCTNEWSVWGKARVPILLRAGGSVIGQRYLWYLWTISVVSHIIAHYYGTLPVFHKNGTWEKPMSHYYYWPKDLWSGNDDICAAIRA